MWKKKLFRETQGENCRNITFSTEYRSLAVGLFIVGVIVRRNFAATGRLNHVHMQKEIYKDQSHSRSIALICRFIRLSLTQVLYENKVPNPFQHKHKECVPACWWQTPALWTSLWCTPCTRISWCLSRTLRPTFHRCCEAESTNLFIPYNLQTVYNNYLVHTVWLSTNSMEANTT